MTLKEKDSDKIIDFVKRQPRTIQEISKHIGKSWLTADSYVKQIKDTKGVLDTKTYRAGTRGALKIVFYNYSEYVNTDDIKEAIFKKIISSTRKEDFDFMDIFQNVSTKSKKITASDIDDPDEYRKMKNFLEQAAEKVYIFSGNLSFTNLGDRKRKIIDTIEDLLKRKVSVKIICRINLATITNISRISGLEKEYPNFLEVRHSYQPLRGFIIDGKASRFISEEETRKYKVNELPKNLKIFYDIYDESWNSWLENVFWSIYRSSSECNSRIKELDRIKIT